MRTNEETVKTQDGGEFTFEMPLPETIEEAVENFGNDNAIWLLNSGLKVRLQSIAREKFRQGLSREEAEEAIKNYQPGASSKKGVRQRAMELITDKAFDIQNDPDLKEKVREAFVASDYKEVISLLSAED
jgi:hypothetical protein